MGFSRGSDGKESGCNAGDPGSIPGQEDPWRREWQRTPVFLPEFHGQRHLLGYSPWGRKSLIKLNHHPTTPRFHLYYTVEGVGLSKEKYMQRYI